MIRISPVYVDLLLDSGPEVSVISKEVVTKIQKEHPNIELTCPPERRVCVVTAFEQQNEIDTERTAWIFPWSLHEGNILFIVLFVILPSPGNLDVIGHLTLRAMLGTDMLGQPDDANELLNNEVRKEEPWALEAPDIEIDHRPHLTIEALRGVREGELGGGCMNEVTDKSISKKPTNGYGAG